MQVYYKKVVEDITEEMVGTIWKRMDWHGLLTGGTPEKSDDEDKDDNNNGGRVDKRENDDDDDSDNSDG